MKKSTLDTFIDELIAQRGYEDAPQKVKEELHNDLKGRLDKFVMTRTIAEFSPEEVDAFEKLLDEEKSPEELKQFSMDHIPDYSTFMAATLLTFRDAYLS